MVVNDSGEETFRKGRGAASGHLEPRVTDLLPELMPQTLRQAQERLEEMETQVQKLQQAVEQASGLFREAPHATLLISAQGRILEANGRAVDLLGIPVSDLLGRQFAAFLPTASQGLLGTLLKKVFGTGTRQNAEVQLLARGEVLEVLLDATPHQSAHRAASGELVCQMTLTDVTAFKTAHLTLLDTVQAQAQQLREQETKFRQLNEEFERVVLMSGEELRRPLERADRALTELGGEHLHPSGSDHLKEAREALIQSHCILDSVKQYMRSHTLRPRVRPVDLRVVLREVMQELEPQLQGRNVELRQEALPTLQGDGQVLRMILHEYLANALKFTRPRPEVRLYVRVRETEADHLIGVEDNGVGFNMRQKERIFDLFVKLNGENFEGSGLGLTVVRRLCERFGGRAWAEGKVGQGATFWFAWPKQPSSPDL